MLKPESLDELISNKAIEFADQIRAAAAMADKEEEIRIESEKQLAFIQKEAGIKLEGKHEFTVASGRIDSVYSRVIIEYKNPKNPDNRDYFDKGKASEVSRLITIYSFHGSNWLT